MNFDQQALEVFEHQVAHSDIYRRYVDLLGIDVSSVTTIEDIPFLPIEFFRSHRIYSAQNEPQLIFSSSGTTGADTSHHYVASAARYEQSILDGFTHFYGDPSQYELRTLLPSYRDGSSLLYMVSILRPLCTGQRVLLLGVTFALLEEACSGKCQKLPADSIVMETGGMKGRMQQIEREQLHGQLCRAFGVERIHSEYGMCELLSQSYSDGDGIFRPSPSMRVMTRRLDNPLRAAQVGEVGGINVVDLNNIDSCSFIATADRGIVHADGSFEVLGRIEGEILRGCNML